MPIDESTGEPMEPEATGEVCGGWESVKMWAVLGVGDSMPWIKDTGRCGQAEVQEATTGEVWEDECGMRGGNCQGLGTCTEYVDTSHSENPG